jgi:diguanylate cyclase (GGDEF)-like protein/PAS domain S-box-containing protein
MTANDAGKILSGYGSEMLLLVDLATLTIREANEAAARHLGYAREDLIGRTITDIACACADVSYWENVRREGASGIRDVETSYLRADGEWLNVSGRLIFPAPHPDSLIVSLIPTGEPGGRVAHLLAALEATSDGLLLLDSRGTVVHMNHRFARVWQFPDEMPPIGGDCRAVFESMSARMDDPEAYRRRLAEIRPDGEDEVHDFLTLGDGRFIECRSRPSTRGKTIIGRVFSFAEVTGQKVMESRLMLTETVFSRVSEGVMITDAAGDILDVNATFCRTTGYAREEVIGRNPRFLKSGRHGEDFYRTMWNELTAQGHWEGEVWNRRKDGLCYAERLSIAAVRDATGAPAYYIAILSDITELKGYQQQIGRMAHYDALTGMPNRVLFTDRLNLAIAQARRYPRCVALVHLDVDGFKEINDRHGHETGDQLLVIIARNLRDTLREGDTLARLSGDEFAAIIVDLDGQTEYKPILTRLLDAVGTPLIVQRKMFRISASLGATLFPQDDSDADTLLRHATQAMYQAKQAGKNCYRLFDPEKERQTQTHHKSLDRIAQAIARNEFELYFQPKVNMRTGVVVGAEALIRWRHPERGLVPPGDFLPAIEGSELMVRLGEWVLGAALLQMTTWYRQGLDIAVSVNVAACHLQQADFLSNLEKKLSAYPAVKPNRLEFEVLETAALAGISQITRLIEGCRAIGVRFSLDDFGTG